jgi:hypothetical protein
MSVLKKPTAQGTLTAAELEEERAQLQALRKQRQINKKLIDLALKSDAPRMTIDEINEYLGRNRWEKECEHS